MGSLHVLKRQWIELRELGADTVAIDMHIAQPEREREEKQLGWLLIMEGVLTNARPHFCFGIKFFC